MDFGIAFVPGSATGFVSVDQHRLEYRTIGEPGRGRPALVFLHEGLGCVALWRAFPDRVCAATGLPGLVYSRAGHGQSDVLDAPRRPRFMHDEAQRVLPELLERRGIDDAILVGHSDGASIALIHAGQRPRGLRAVVAIAPHLFVERLTIASIAGIAAGFDAGDLPRRMAKYHRDPRATFHGWADVWLDPAFRDWNIEADVARIACPVLALQGTRDEYGTMEQVRRVEQLSPHARWVGIDDAGHAPFADQPERVLAEIVQFVTPLAAADSNTTGPPSPAG